MEDKFAHSFALHVFASFVVSRILRQCRGHVLQESTDVDDSMEHQAEVHHSERFGRFRDCILKACLLTQVCVNVVSCVCVCLDAQAPDGSCLA